MSEELKYDVYEWHLGNEGKQGTQMTIAEIMALDFTYVKFDKGTKRAWVTNCCDFKCH